MYKNGNPNYNEYIFTKEEQDDIVNSYLSGESSVSIGKRYNMSHKPILKLLHKLNVEVSQAKLVRKYSLDEKYFDQINTANKAYILGLLYSDGSNNPQKSTISISMQEEDKNLLEKVRLEIKSENPLEFLDYSNKHSFGYNYKNQYRLIFFSTYMSNRLSQLGVIPNKSLKITFPTFISKELMPHFIRGVYDGDGSICRQIKNENNHAILITITATDNFCNSLKKIIKEELNINSGIYDASCHNEITKVLSISGRNICKKFLDWIYQDADIYLERKYNRYIEYYNINNSLLA